MRKIIVAGNWKMHTDRHEARTLAQELVMRLSGLKRTKIILCPPFTALFDISEILKGKPLGLGAQNMYYAPEGAFTGEISGKMLRSVGCQYVILGHSERRHIFGETDEMIQRKVPAALQYGLKPIICIGETLSQRQEDKTLDIVEEQLKAALATVTVEQIKDCIIAYEPVWAIGTGINATPQQAAEVHALIRQLLGQLYNPKIAAEITIQYGGSVKPENASALIQEPNIDGFLVGGASLKAEDFTQIALTVEKIKQIEEK
jgi:triosephosphate isomerase